MATPRPSEGEPPLGDLVSEVITDVQTLLRQEVELAKAEIREETSRAGKAAGMYGGAGFAGYMVAVLLSFTAVFALDNVLGLAWSALIVTGVWALIGAVLFLVGRSTMRSFSPKPQQTLESLKEDAQWARHPVGSRPTSTRRSTS
ncbi:phage holin family protein [Streptomyces sp. YIM 98790]|uniref:phage holin family protein n=1 Tax=Streptomyces sp. YIM 98790 TaxID=2689077 RepID=UPI0014086C0A|nr:phage holin family protein [Streptomyces sp. YIM 98790]